MTRVIMKCPECGSEYELGFNFCKNCESVLEAIESEEDTPSTKPFQGDIKVHEEIIIDKELVKKKEEVKEIREEIEKSLIKAVIKELLIIKDERDKYKKLLQNLEERKGEIEENSYNESKAIYENNLIEIAKRFKDLKETYTGLKEKVSNEIQILERIRKANLNKDIELFNSCYSQDYEGLDKRKEKALTLWKNFDFIHLEYNLKESIIKQKEGTIRVGWDIKVRSRSGEIKDIKDDFTVFIIKDDNLWKIKRVIKEKV